MSAVKNCCSVAVINKVSQNGRGQETDESSLTSTIRKASYDYFKRNLLKTELSPFSPNPMLCVQSKQEDKVVEEFGDDGALQLSLT